MAARAGGTPMGRLKFRCRHCGWRVTTTPAMAGKNGGCPSCGGETSIPPLPSAASVKVARWFLYGNEDDALAALKCLKVGLLAGPGWLELRRREGAEEPWAIVLYDIISAPANDMQRVYRLPAPVGEDAWFAGDPAGKLPIDAEDGEQVEIVEVRATDEALTRAAKHLGDLAFGRDPETSCAEEAKIRKRISDSARFAAPGRAKKTESKRHERPKGD